MSTLKITRFSIHFKALVPMQFPEYAGSALRGAFGHALKSIACLTASRNRGICNCQPAESCLYRQLFDPVQKELKTQQRKQDVPPPLVVEAHGLPISLQAEEHAHFHIVLIGEMAHHQQMIIQLAWQRALAVGIGQHLSTGESQAELLSFQICDQPQQYIEARSELKLSLATLVRLQHHGGFLRPEQFDPPTFCWAIFRRYLTVAEVYSNLTIDDAFKQHIYQQIQQVTGTANLEWVEWIRYSNRQKKFMNLDGLRGDIELQNISDELYYYLYLGQWLHVGKGCVFGLGQYTLR